MTAMTAMCLINIVCLPEKKVTVTVQQALTITGPRVVGFWSAAALPSSILNTWLHPVPGMIPN